MEPPAVDVGLLSSVWAGNTSDSSDTAVLQAILDVEAAWVHVLERAGLAPAGSHAVVQQVAGVGAYNAVSIAHRAQGGGNPVIPLLSDLRARVADADPAALPAVHRGLTSQDVMDTALMLMAHRATAVISADLRQAARDLAGLAATHIDTPQVARTLTQHSLPSTFGLKAAQWLHGLGDAGTGLDQTLLPVQCGGAAGTLAALSSLTRGIPAGPLQLAQDHAELLGLHWPGAPWHTARSPITRLGDALTTVLGACGKIANDVLLLSRPELGELAEPRKVGRGVSSAMPQKQNPVLSVLIRSAALAGPVHASQLHLASATAIDERSDGAWHLEWAALRHLLRLTAGAAHATRELVAGLQVFPDRMLTNLQLSGPLLVSERIMAEAAPLLDAHATPTDAPGTDSGSGPKASSGRDQIQALVEQSLAGAGDLWSGLRAAVPAEALTDAQLSDLLDPANYTGEAAALTRTLISSYKQWSTP